MARALRVELPKEQWQAVIDALEEEADRRSESDWCGECSDEATRRCEDRGHKTDERLADQLRELATRVWVQAQGAES